MHGTGLDALVLEHGKSEDIRAALDCLRDASAADGGPRYSEKVCRDVARAVVCRTYAKPILELSHMIVAASSAGGRFEDIFWGVDRATGAAFHRCFKELAHAATGLECGERVLTAHYGDGRFEISYSRMPFLAALLEFLVGTVGYAEIDAAATRLHGRPASAAEVSAVASALSKRLYDFLKDHLPSIQTRRRERHFLEFVADRRAGATGADAIDDDVTLDYWRRYAGDEEVEARAYRTIHEAASRLIVALEAATARLAAERARPIGVDVEAGEVDPADVEWVTSRLDDGVRSVADIVLGAPSEARLVVKTELELLSEIPAFPGVGRRLPKSILRAAVFGFQQSRIGNALRRAQASDEVVMLCRCGDVETYAEHLAKYRKL